jgi:hypothetical protein
VWRGEREGTSFFLGSIEFSSFITSWSPVLGGGVKERNGKGTEDEREGRQLGWGNIGKSRPLIEKDE